MVGDDGADEELDNPLITSTQTAKRAAELVREVLTARRTFGLNWRPDTRLDAGDVILVEGKYAAYPARVTELNYEFAGAYLATAKAQATE